MALMKLLTRGKAESPPPDPTESTVPPMPVFGTSGKSKSPNRSVDGDSQARAQSPRDSGLRSGPAAGSPYASGRNSETGVSRISVNSSSPNTKRTHGSQASMRSEAMGSVASEGMAVARQDGSKMSLDDGAPAAGGNATALGGLAGMVPNLPMPALGKLNMSSLRGSSVSSAVEAGPLGREILEAQEDMRRELANVSSRVSINAAGYSTTTIADSLARQKFAEVSDRLKASDAKLEGFSTRLVALEELGVLIVKERETRALSGGGLPSEADLAGAVARIAGPILTKALAPLIAELRTEVDLRGQMLQKELNAKVQAIQDVLSVAKADSAWGAGWRAGQLSMHMRTSSSSLNATPVHSAVASRNRDDAVTPPGSRSASRNPDLATPPTSFRSSRDLTGSPPTKSPQTTFVLDLAAALRPVATVSPTGSARPTGDQRNGHALASGIRPEGGHGDSSIARRNSPGRELTLGMDPASPGREPNVDTVNVDCRTENGTSGAQFFL